MALANRPFRLGGPMAPFPSPHPSLFDLMANIPVERTGSTGGTPWWAWLIGLLLLIGLIWLLASALTDDDMDTRTAAVDTTTAVTPAPTPTTTDTEVLTDPVALANAPNTRVYDGRDVRFSDMRVEVAYSDSVFYAVPADDPVDRRFFVVVGNPATPGIGGPATLEVGDRVTVHGRIDDTERDDLARWDIAADERDRLMRYEDYYVRATRIDR